MITSNLAIDIVLLVFGLAFLIITYLGFANELVIYQDKKDFLRTVLLAIGLVASIYLANLGEIDDHNKEFLIFWIIAPITYLATFILLMDCFYLCITNNNNAYIVGSLIAIFRLIYITFAFLLILKILDSREKDRSFRSTIFQLALLGAVGYVLKLLINGNTVQKKRQMRSQLGQLLE